MCKKNPCCCPLPESRPTIRPFIPDNSGLLLALISARQCDGYIGPIGPVGPQGPTGPQGNSTNCDCKSYIVESENITTTNSSTDILMNNMFIIPIAGTYSVWFSGELDNSQGNSTMTTSIYYGNVVVPASQRIVLHNSDIGSFACMAIVTVDGTQSIEGRWRTDKGTATNFHRSLLILRTS